MTQPTFFKTPVKLTLAQIAALTGAQLADPSRAGQTVSGVSTLDAAGPMHLAFFDKRKYGDELAQSHAGACLVSEKLQAEVPARIAILRVANPYAAFWFGIFYTAFYLTDTVTNVPYEALGPELSDVYEERSRIYFVHKFFNMLGEQHLLPTHTGLIC